jgi:hypothetical protein
VNPFTSQELAETIRGASALVLDEVNAAASDLCRTEEVADACPIFASVTIEGLGPVELPTDNPSLAWFDVPTINGPTFRVMVFNVTPKAANGE